MQSMRPCLGLFFLSCLLSSCSSTFSFDEIRSDRSSSYTSSDYAARLPLFIDSHEKVVLVDPSVHAWGAYDAKGNFVRGGLATAGADWCRDLNRPCHTHAGSYRVYFKGSIDCKSSVFPVPKGGAPMPYCMYFNGNQALHGSQTKSVIAGNISHGCVRMHVTDAQWLHYNFVDVGTKVVVRPY